MDKAVVDSLRALWRERFGPPDLSPLVMSDEEVWACHEEMEGIGEFTLCCMAYRNDVLIEGEWE